MKRLFFMTLIASTVSVAMKDSPAEKALTDICRQNREYRSVHRACPPLLKYFRCARLLAHRNANRGDIQDCENFISRYPASGRMHWIAYMDIEFYANALRSAQTNIDFPGEIPDDRAT